MDVRRLIDAELPSGGVPFGLDADGAVARGRTARRRRRVATWGAAGLPVVAVAVLAVALGTPAARSPQPAGSDPVAGPSISGSPVPSRPAFDLPDFPVTPGWVPPGLGEPHYQYDDLGGETTEVRKAYAIELVHYSPDGPAWRVSAEPNDTTLELDEWKATHSYPDLAVTDTTVTVRGREARLLAVTGTTDEDEDGAPRSVELAVVSWRHQPDLWVTVSGDTEANVLRYAEELVGEPFPAQTPFTFESVPEGAEVVAASPAGMTLGLPERYQPSGPLAGVPSFPRQLSVAVTAGRVGPQAAILCRRDEPQRPAALEPCPDPTRQPVQVGDHDGELVGTREVLVDLPEGLVLQVTDQSGLLGKEDLVGFAAGVDLTEFARPGGS